MKRIAFVDGREAPSRESERRRAIWREITLGMRSHIMDWCGSAVVLAIVLLAMIGLTSGRAAADGKVFSAVAGLPPTIPDQQALICFKDGVQTLAIETRFEGSGSDFAWVVPLPSEPEIRATTAGMFPSLRSVFLPAVGRVPVWLDLLARVAGVLSCLLMVLIVCRPTRPRLSLTLVLLGFVAGILLLPSLGTARGNVSAPVVGDVRVMDRAIVGSYETTTIRSDSPDALVEWLNSNGFVTPEEARPAIAAYVADGWCFVASKLRRTESPHSPDGVPNSTVLASAGSTSADGARSMMTAHPLVFTFKAASPVYPMRLTMTQREPVSLEIAVFADRAASIPGLTVVSSSPVDDDRDAHARELRPRHYRDRVVVTHDAILAIAGSLPWATKLSGTIAADFTGDLRVSLAKGPVVRPVRFSGADATGMGIRVGLIALCPMLFSLALWRECRKPSTDSVQQYLARSVLAAIALVGVVAWATPTTTLSMSAGSRVSWSRAASAASEVADAVQRRRALGGFADLDWIRDELARALAKPRRDDDTSPKDPVLTLGDAPGQVMVVEPADQPGMARFYLISAAGTPIDLRASCDVDPPEGRTR